MIIFYRKPILATMQKAVLPHYITQGFHLRISSGLLVLFFNIYFFSLYSSTYSEQMICQVGSLRTRSLPSLLFYCECLKQYIFMGVKGSELIRRKRNHYNKSDERRSVSGVRKSQPTVLIWLTTSCL